MVGSDGARTIRYCICSHSHSVIYGVAGLLRIRNHKRGDLLSLVTLPYWGLISVGVLSGWFHATLKYHSQMGDDLSMFLCVGALLHQLLCFKATAQQQRNYTLIMLGTIIPVSVYHCVADEIYVHQATFATMIFMSSRRMRQLINEQARSDEERVKLQRLARFGLGEFNQGLVRVQGMLMTSTATGLFGYFLWNIDFHLCNHVTAFKHRLGLPFGFLFELHGWWHILTGINSYVALSIVEYLVTMDDKRVGSVEQGFLWPVETVLGNLEAEHEGKKEK